MAVSVDEIVSVSVQVSNPVVITSDFNVGCIIGNSAVLTENDRVKSYDRKNYAVQMVADGFNTGSVEYLAAVAYFAQEPSPGQLIVGVKLEEETDAQAFIATRAANDEFYGVSFAYETEDANMQAVATAVEASDIPTMFFFQTKDENCLVLKQENIMKTFMQANYNRSVPLYSAQNNFCNGVMGVFCGLNTMQANSAYTMAFKPVIGFTSEDLSNAQVNALKSYNGNAYVAFGRRYNFFFPGVVSSGRHIDSQFMIDAIQSLIQEYVVAGLTSRRVVPQTEDGLAIIKTFISQACTRMAQAGFISAGVWTGENVMDLSYGDALSQGFMIQSESIAEQSPQDRAQRISPAIYVALKGAGAIESVVVSVFLNE